jgi:hypothetical protein
LSTPWIKFWTRDYLGDARLSSCSLAAQGLWLRIVCLMAQQVEPGILYDTDGPWSDEDIFRAVGVHDSSAKSLLAQLESRGAFSRTAKGALLNRRLVREAHVRAAGMERTERWRERQHNARDAIGDGGVTTPPEARGQITPPLTPPQAGGDAPPVCEQVHLNIAGTTIVVTKPKRLRLMTKRESMTLHGARAEDYQLFFARKGWIVEVLDRDKISN